MSDEFIIKRKLMFDGDGKGEEKKLLTFVKLLPKYFMQDDPATSEATYNKILAQLESIVAGRRKIELARKSNDEQIKMYKILQSTYLARITTIKEDIEKQQDLLRKAKTVKQNYVQYDLLVKTVSKESSRKLQNKEIDNLNKKLEELERDKNYLDKKLNGRVKQCYVLSTSANTLNSILQDDHGDGKANASSSNSESSDLDKHVALS